MICKSQKFWQVPQYSWNEYNNTLKDQSGWQKDEEKIKSAS